MEEFMIEMEIITYGMVHHMAKAFFYLKVFLPAYMAKLTLQSSTAVKAVVFFTVMFLHFINEFKRFQ